MATNMQKKASKYLEDAKNINRTIVSLKDKVDTSSISTPILFKVFIY